MNKKALITGSAGLIGSESARFMIDRGYDVVGVDNDLRAYFFGQSASTAWNNARLKEQFGDRYLCHPIDIRDNQKIAELFRAHRFDIIIHTAAQPSHDWAAKEPFTDFGVNATGTLVMLENYRQFCPEATFIFTSTNKVYGDRPNTLPLVEQETRFELPPDHRYFRGIDETMSIDSSLHSIFGASKVAADVMVQEYGRYFNLPTGVFRGGCLTGPNHSGAELHGFLAYLVQCILTGKKYLVNGYQGKQVRDNIHSFDLVNMFWNFHQKPRPGEVYNAGGGRQSNVSLREAIDKIERLTGKPANYEYRETNRIGDHIWYISDLTKFQTHYPNWHYTYNLDRILEELCRSVHVA
ncbi:MAG: NAD-dependent epimerase/dehydratase family protein [Candidatus Magasanikbacteria bacterium]|nr:NAD-dependent epimerase/dehydratase family protein [Candidatus Magasanikbacteria bacterium]